MSVPPTNTESLAGVSGRLPETFVKWAPPSVDSNTCPVLAPGRLTHRRENPENVTKMCELFAGSIVMPVM